MKRRIHRNKSQKHTETCWPPFYPSSCFNHMNAWKTIQGLWKLHYGSNSTRLLLPLPDKEVLPHPLYINFTDKAKQSCWKANSQRTLLAITWDAVVVTQGLLLASASTRSTDIEGYRSVVQQSTFGFFLNHRIYLFAKISQKHLLTSLRDSINILHIYSVLQVTHAKHV